MLRLSAGSSGVGTCQTGTSRERVLPRDRWRSLKVMDERERTHAERERLRHEAIVGAVEDGDVTWFDSPLSQYRRRQTQRATELERDPPEPSSE